MDDFAWVSRCFSSMGSFSILALTQRKIGPLPAFEISRVRQGQRLAANAFSSMIHSPNFRGFRLALTCLIFPFLAMWLRAATQPMIHPPIIERVRLSEAYTNAVFHAIWPLVTNAARHLDLPPVTIEQIRRFECGDYKRIEAHVTLTNYFWFLIEEGHISLFDSKNTYYTLNQWNRIHEFYGKLNLTKEQAIEKVRSYVRGLGYDLKETYLDEPPTTLKGPNGKGKKLIPRYWIEWKWPEGPARFEVNGENGRIEYASLGSGPIFDRPYPELSVKAELTAQSATWWKENGISESYSRALTQAVLPLIEDFVQRLDLPIELPLSMDSVAQFIGHRKLDWDGPFNPAFESVYLEVFLKDGNAFCLCNGYVVEFHAADSISWAKKYAPRYKLVASWKMTDKEAVHFARDALQKLGHSIEDFHAEERPSWLLRNPPFGAAIIPRVFITWGKHTDSVADFEIDGSKGNVKYLKRSLPKVNKPWPDLGVPMR
jgi:hypothetical protein